MALTSGTRQLLRETASWAVVAVIAVAAFMQFDELRSGAAHMLGMPASQDAAGSNSDGRDLAQPASHGRVVTIEAGQHGHFRAEAEINGRPVEVMIDTGASMIALSYEDATRAGVYVKPSDFTGRVSTANGITHIAPVMLDRVSVGDITVRNVPAAVLERGRLRTSLLGMSFLNRLSRFDMRAGELVLQE